MELGSGFHQLCKVKDKRYCYKIIFLCLFSNKFFTYMNLLKNLNKTSLLRSTILFLAQNIFTSSCNQNGV